MRMAPHGNPSQSYGASPAIWDHTVFVTCHMTRVNAPRLNPSQTGWYSIYLPRRDGRLSWLWCSYTRRWFTCPQTVTHPNSNHLIATRPGVEPTISLNVTQPSHLYLQAKY